MRLLPPAGEGTSGHGTTPDDPVRARSPPAWRVTVRRRSGHASPLGPPPSPRPGDTGHRRPARPRHAARRDRPTSDGHTPRGRSIPRSVLRGDGGAPTRRSTPGSPRSGVRRRRSSRSLGGRGPPTSERDRVLGARSHTATRPWARLSSRYMGSHAAARGVTPLPRSHPATTGRDRSSYRPRFSRSAARSATAMVGAFVLPPGMVGMTEASTTRRPSTPWTRSSSSTTAIPSSPIRQVPTGW